MLQDLTKCLKSTVLVESIMPNEHDNRFGTGSILQHKSKLLLATNAHIINNANNIYIYCLLYNKDNDKSREMKVKIDSSKTVYHNKYDLCVINLSNQLNEDDKYKIIYHPLDVSMIPSDYSLFDNILQLYMIGYPNCIRDTTYGMPVIKSGISSTLLSIDYDQNQEFLADIGGIKGSSGSPVFTIYENKLYLVGINYESFNYIKKINNNNIPLPTGISKILKASLLLDMV